MSLQIRQKEICFSDTWPLSQYPHNRIWPSSLSSRCSALLRKLQGFTHTFVNFSDIIHSYGNISPGDEKFWVSPTEPGWGGQWGAGERGGEAAVCLLHIVILKWRHLFSLGLVFTCIWVLDITRKTKLSPSKAGPRKWPFDVFSFGVPCGMWVLPPLSDLVELLVRPQCSSGSYCEWMNCSREHWLAS